MDEADVYSDVSDDDEFEVLDEVEDDEYDNANYDGNLQNGEITVDTVVDQSQRYNEQLLSHTNQRHPTSSRPTVSPSKRPLREDNASFPHSAEADSRTVCSQKHETRSTTRRQTSAGSPTKSSTAEIKTGPNKSLPASSRTSTTRDRASNPGKAPATSSKSTPAHNNKSGANKSMPIHGNSSAPSKSRPVHGTASKSPARQDGAASTHSKSPARQADAPSASSKSAPPRSYQSAPSKSTPTHNRASIPDNSSASHSPSGGHSATKHSESRSRQTAKSTPIIKSSDSTSEMSSPDFGRTMHSQSVMTPSKIVTTETKVSGTVAAVTDKSVTTSSNAVPRPLSQSPIPAKSSDAKSQHISAGYRLSEKDSTFTQQSPVPQQKEMPVESSDASLDKKPEHDRKSDIRYRTLFVHPLKPAEMIHPDLRQYLMKCESVSARFLGVSGSDKKGHLQLRFASIQETEDVYHDMVNKKFWKPVLSVSKPGMKMSFALDTWIMEWERDLAIPCADADSRSTVFVNNIPTGAGQPLLRALFPIASNINIPKKDDTTNMGYATLDFGTAELAETSVARASGFMVDGHPLSMTIITRNPTAAPVPVPTTSITSNIRKNETFLGEKTEQTSEEESQLRDRQNANQTETLKTDERKDGNGNTELEKTNRRSSEAEKKTRTLEDDKRDSRNHDDDRSRDRRSHEDDRRDRRSSEDDRRSDRRSEDEKRRDSRSMEDDIRDRNQKDDNRLRRKEEDDKRDARYKDVVKDGRGIRNMKDELRHSANISKQSGDGIRSGHRESDRTHSLSDKSRQNDRKRSTNIETLSHAYDMLPSTFHKASRWDTENSSSVPEMHTQAGRVGEKRSTTEVLEEEPDAKVVKDKAQVEQSLQGRLRSLRQLKAIKALATAKNVALQQVKAMQEQIEELHKPSDKAKPSISAKTGPAASRTPHRMRELPSKPIISSSGTRIRSSTSHSQTSPAFTVPGQPVRRYIQASNTDTQFFTTVWKNPSLSKPETPSQGCAIPVLKGRSEIASSHPKSKSIEASIANQGVHQSNFTYVPSYR